LLQQNKKIQEANRAPDDFPSFIREGEKPISDDAGCVFIFVSDGAIFLDVVRN
jgi:hypothetical protein